MGNFLGAFLSRGEFLPHGLCLTWRPELIWTHLLSDLLIGFAYFSIPVGLLYFVLKRQDLAYKWIFVMFGAFILACGVTHFFSAWTLWNPDYVLQGAIKAFTATISVVTAAVLWPLIPQALALPSPAQLRAANRELETQILERQRAEHEVRRVNAELERRVAERTAALEAANEALRMANETLERRVAERTRELSATNERLRASEANYAGMFNHLPDGVFVVRVERNAEFRFESLNPAHERWTGLCSADISGLTPHSIFDADLADHVVGKYKQCLEAGSPIDYEETLALPAGVRTFQTILTPIRDAEDRIVKLIGTARDITEHRALQEELAQTSKLATLGTMAAGIAHEMSQPLNIIRITADDCRLMLEDGEAELPYIGQSLTLIGTQAKRMGEIVDQMRSFSRRDTVTVEPFDPAHPVQGAVALLARHYASDGIDINLSIEPHGGLVSGQPGRLEQVLLNLLSNARDAIHARRESTPGSYAGTIRVDLSEDKSHYNLVIRVTDDGIGIPPELVERIFDPFFTTKEAEKGVGLGLSICASIVNAMGGRITAERLDQGSRFTLTLPIRKFSAEASHE